MKVILFAAILLVAQSSCNGTPLLFPSWSHLPSYIAEYISNWTSTRPPWHWVIGIGNSSGLYIYTAANNTNQSAEVRVESNESIIVSNEEMGTVSQEESSEEYDYSSSEEV